MKKLLFVVIVGFIILYIASKGFLLYKQHNLLNNEAVVTIYFNMDEKDIDAYFNLPKGTFDKNKNYIYCSLKRDNSSLLDEYCNLRIVRGNDKNINCEEEFSNEKHLRFNKNEIGNYKTLYIRLSTNPNSITSSSSYADIATKTENIDFQFGKINNFIISKDGIENYCD